MGTVLNGKKRALEIRAEILEEVKNIRLLNIIPTIALLHVGDIDGSAGYINRKADVCRAALIEPKVISFPMETTEQDLISTIIKLDKDESIHGILLQLPLPENINEENASNAISLEKDVDGVTLSGLGCLLSGKPRIISAGARAAFELIKMADAHLEEKSVCVLGDSIILGRPFAAAAINLGATVKMLSSDNTEYQQYSRDADILLVDVGKPKAISSLDVKKGSIVLDAGNNYLNGKLVGDVDFEQVAPITSAITPVPGGIGPLLIAMLLKNLLEAVNKKIRI